MATLWALLIQNTTHLIQILNSLITIPPHEKNVRKWDKILRNENHIISLTFAKKRKQEQNHTFIEFLIGRQAMLSLKILNEILILITIKPKLGPVP